MGVFTWTGTGVYPPSAGAWGGQPLSVAPSQTYWTPQIKPPAENWNYVLAQIAENLANLQPEVVVCTTSQAVPIPSWAAWILIDGCGSGGSGGGGSGAGLGTTDTMYPGGGGGAGAQRASMLFPVGAMTEIYVTVGAAVAGGAGGTPASSTPVIGGAGVDGNASCVNPGSAFNATTIFANFPGGAGGGAGGIQGGTTAAPPSFTPGGVGQAGRLRGGPSAIPTLLAPGPAQLQNLVNITGTISGPAGGWPASVYNDPVGPTMRAGDGGASYANANSAYSGISYAGGDATEGGTGGLPGAAGTKTGSYYGGAGGGGGGGGGFGAAPLLSGGNGGNGATGDAPHGSNGVAGGANTGAGGGGGGASGCGSTAVGSGTGIGGNGGASGSGQVIVMFFGAGG